MTDLSKDFDLATWSGDHREAPFIIVADDRDGGRDMRIVDLTVRLPDEKRTELVRNLNLTIPKGSRVVLTGESGSGKTVTAKAIMNQWDIGTGLVVMPAGARTMMMSQQAYFANTTMRGILNNSPEENAGFSDDELAGALHAVGHDKLIQHIPGQQVLILMHDLLRQVEDALKPYANKTLSPSDMESIQKDLVDRAVSLAREQFSVVQFTPPAQRDFFREQLGKTMNKALANPPAQQDIDGLADAVADRIDTELARPLADHLAKTVSRAAQGMQKIFPMTPAKINYFAHALEKKLEKRVRSYMANKDTDDLDRPVRINKAQADYVVGVVTQSLKDGLQARASSGALSQVFNAATWPLSLQTLRTKARNLASDLTDSLTFFMEKQVMTGDRLTLSGGEKQKLMIAMVLLHKPDILVLDEITAALDRETGERLYKEMMEQIPAETTVISIAHNEHIVKYHTHHAHLANKTITMTDLRPSGPQPDFGGPRP